MSQYQEMSGETHESWHEMQEALHEAYEMQEQEAALSGEVNGARIVTPAVIIRITLAPARRGAPSAVFGSPRAVVGATSARVQAAPLSGNAYVPLRLRDAQNGRFTGGGAVYVPQRGGNVVQAATWTPPGGNNLRQTGTWLRQQIVQAPALRRRIRRVQVLVDGKPCQHCVKQLASTVKPVVPPGTKLGVRFAPTLPATAAPQRTVSQAAGTRNGYGTVPQRRPMATTPRPGYATTASQPLQAAPPRRPVSQPVSQQRLVAPRPRPMTPAPVSTAPRRAAAPPLPPRNPQTGKFVSAAAKPAAGAPKSVLGQALREVGL